jgi:hypothetical protein
MQTIVNQARRNAWVAIRYFVICGSAHLHVKKGRRRIDAMRKRKRASYPRQGYGGSVNVTNLMAMHSLSTKSSVVLNDI